MMLLEFSPSDARCHGNKIWDIMGYNSAYVRDISKIFASDGVFSRSVYFGMGSAQLFKNAHMHAPPQKSYVKYTKNLYYLATKNISTFSNIAIIN